MLHNDVDTDRIINCKGELTDAAQEKDTDGRPLLFLLCSRCGMEFAFSVSIRTELMLMPGSDSLQPGNMGRFGGSPF